LEESQGLSQEASEEAEVSQFTAFEEENMNHDFGDDMIETKSKIIIVRKEKEEQMEVETNELPAVQEVPPQEELDVADIKYNVEEMTVIDEVTEDGGQEERTETPGENEVGEQTGVGESGDGVSRAWCSCVLRHFCSCRSLDKEIWTNFAPFTTVLV
jgi:hypothetical protein